MHKTRGDDRVRLGSAPQLHLASLAHFISRASHLPWQMNIHFTRMMPQTVRDKGNK